MPSAGELRDPIRIERRTAVADGQGGTTGTWSLVAAVWAKVMPISGNERAEAGQVRSQATYRVTIRRRTDLQEGDRITWQGIRLNIRYLNMGGPHQFYMAMDCESGTPE